jgi:signal transduction histidine kinase
VAGDEEWRVYTIHLADRTVQSVQSADFRDEVVRGQALQSGLPVALLIPVSIVMLCFAIRASLRRLELVAQAAAHQDEHNLTHLPLEHVPAEIRPLVASVNRLLARMRCAFDAQRRFVHDAAHELRTPITALSLQLENLRANANTGTASEQFAQLEAGVARMKRLVEQLLRLARQEAIEGDCTEAVEVVDLLREVVGEILPLADRRHIDVGFGACRSIVLRGDRTELRSVFHNLLDNAVRYTPIGGTVEIRVSDRNAAPIVEIVDTGPGIPEALLPRVFDRFFRIEGSETEGSGLGLAIARHAAARNRLQIELRNRHDCSGLIACVHIEAGAPSAAAATGTNDGKRALALGPPALSALPKA